MSSAFNSQSSKQSDSIDGLITLFHYVEASLLTRLKNQQNIIFSKKQIYSYFNHFAKQLEISLVPWS